MGSYDGSVRKEGSGKVMIGRVGKSALVSCRIDQSIRASILPLLIFNV